MSARIYQRFKSTMQSGTRRVGQWTLEFEPAEAKRADPLMGWSGSGDMDQQVTLTFPSLDEAKAYAERIGVDYHVIPAHERGLKLQAYADNFAVGAIIPAGE